MGTIPSYAAVNAGQLDSDDQLIIDVDGTTKSLTTKQLSQVYEDFTELSGTTWDGANKYKTLTGNLALTFSPVNNRIGQLRVQQDGTGSRTLSIDGNAVTIESAAAAVTYISFIWNAGLAKYDFFTSSPALSLASSAPDTTAPTLSTATIETAQPNQLVLTYNEALDSSQLVPNGNIVVTVDGVDRTTSLISISGSTVVATFGGAAVTNGQTVVADYTGTAIKDAAGNSAAAFTNTAVTNNVGAATPLSTPTLTMTAASDTAMDMSWTNVANEDSYTVQIAEDAGFTTGLQTATPAANATTHQFTGLIASTLYYGRVKAEGSGSYSDSAYGTDSESTSAGSAFDIMDIPWTRFWDADLGATTTTSGADLLIDRIDDQVGNASGSNPTTHDLLQNSDLTKRPKLVAAALNGHDVIHIDDATHYLHNSSSLAGKPYTIVALIDPLTVPTTWGQFLTSAGADRANLGYNWAPSTSKFYFYSGAQVIADTPLVQSNTPFVAVMELNGTGSDTLYINETLAVTGNAGTDVGYSGMRVGAISAGALCHVQCIGLINRALTSTERDDVIAFLKTKGGIV